MPEVDVHIKYRCANAPPSHDEMTQSEREAAEIEAHKDLDGREPCSVCGRKFLRDRLPVHEQICLRNASKGPRPKFESAKQRAIADDDAPVGRSRSRLTKPRASETGNRPQPKATKSRPKPEAQPSAKATTKSRPKAQREAPLSNSKPDAVVEGASKRPAGAAPPSNGGRKTLLRHKKVDPFVASPGRFEPSRNGSGRIDTKPRILPTNVTSADNPLLTGWG